MKAGDRLSNGAILLDETIYSTDVPIGAGKTATRSIVLAMYPGAVSPFVTWDRVSENNSTIHDSMALGHYHRSAIEAFAEYIERAERRSHNEENKKAIIERATDDGKERASWWINNDWDYATTRQWFEALDEDIDPEVEDMLPRAPLGGEWADDPTWEQIFRAVCTFSGETVQTHPQYGELEDLYVETYNEAARDEIIDWLAKRLEAFETAD